MTQHSMIILIIHLELFSDSMYCAAIYFIRFFYCFACVNVRGPRNTENSEYTHRLPFFAALLSVN